MTDNTDSNPPDSEYIPELASATGMQLEFINRMAAHGIKVRAAKEAGYSPTSASNAAQVMMKKGWICKAVLQRRAEIDTATLSGAAYVRAELKANHIAAKDAGNLAANNRALELLGKANGTFGPEKHELTGKDGIPLAAPALTDVELARVVSFAIRKGEPDATQIASTSADDESGQATSH